MHTEASYCILHAANKEVQVTKCTSSKAGGFMVPCRVQPLVRQTTPFPVAPVQSESTQPATGTHSAAVKVEPTQAYGGVPHGAHGAVKAEPLVVKTEHHP